jgi:Protein of unknown function (DUF2911)
MRTATLTGILVVSALVASGVVLASQEKKRASPHETVTATVDGAKISVTYGRPYMKGRKVAGGLIPYGAVWRTGADEATTLVTDKGLMFGNTHVSAGTYTLYTHASEKDWQLAINKQTGQWGTEYNAAQDLGRVPLTLAKTPSPVEQFTIAIVDTPAGGDLRLTWDTTQASAPFTVMK